MKTRITCMAVAGAIGAVVIGQAFFNNPGSRPRMPKSAVSMTEYSQRPLAFEDNRGQFDPQVKFVARGNGYNIFLTANETVLSMNGTSGVSSVRINLLDGQIASVEGLEELAGTSHYLIGNDPAKWVRDAPNYAKVRYRNVYPGVDLIYYGSQKHFEHDFVVAPGADAKQVRFRVTGADTVQLDDRGDLVISVSDSEVRLRKPTIYQNEGENREEVPGHYVLTGGQQVSFEIGAYDSTKPLVIDPVLLFSTYLGGNASESFGSALFVDATGSVYVAGPTTSPDFPIVNGLQQRKIGTAVNAFVAKFSADGASLIYSTYLGGSSGDARAIAVDNAGNVIVTGRANSADFPTTENAWQKGFGGGASDAWVAKLSADGSKLLYCTYLGGSGTDNGNDLSVDKQGNAIVTGATSSSDFPVVAAEQTRFGGNFDVFTAKLSPDGRVIYSTYYGGSGEDRGNLISVDAQGNAYVSGRTASADFPIRNGLQQTYGGGQFDAQVIKLNPQGTVVFSTFLGGSGADTGGKTAVDASGNVYLTGTTNSTDFPLVHALQSSFGGGMCASPSRLCYDAFVAKIAIDGATLLYSTYLGGSNEENGIDGMGAIGVDSLGFIYVGGRTASTNFPVVNALQSTYGGGPFDNFAAKLSPDGSALFYSTFLGGNGDDGVYDMKVPSPGNLYVSGFTASTDFPTASPVQGAYGGGTVDAFVSKLSEVPANGAFYFAQAGGGGGFSTAIALSNPSTTQLAQGTVSFFATDGRPLDTVAESALVPFLIPPSRSVVIGTRTQGFVTSGYARISSDAQVFANATYSFPAGQSSLSVAPSSTGSVFVSSINRQGTGVDQGIALVNLTGTRISVNLRLRDAHSERTFNVALASGEQLSRFLSELFSDVPSEFNGTLQIASTPLLPFVGSGSDQLAVTIVEFRRGQMSSIPITVLR